LKQQGTPIGSYDILLAGTALSRKLILVTANTREFDRVNGLVIENWRTK
jgi:tRNA(fMet)-specific endonuclease VapC